MTATQTDILVIGAGLSGVALAEMLQEAGADWRLCEARDRVGGRVLSAGPCVARYDLGPGWTWTGDRRVAAACSRLGVDLFPQYASGRLIFEDAQGDVRRDLDIALMAGANRIDDGIARLTDGLAANLPQERISLGASIIRIERDGARFHLKARGSRDTIHADRVALALPPRVALASIDGLVTISPPAASRIPTWMAGQAKAVAVYDRPFWREAGLSGEAISHRGPLTQIHDASPLDVSEGALIGFLGRRGDQLERAIADQLGSLFGDDGYRPRAVIIQDWARETETTSAADHAAPGQPQPHMAAELMGDARLIWAGSEAALEHTGLLEGAFAAAERAAAALLA